MSKINKEKVLVGSDIEVFLFSEKKGIFISSVGKIEGTKEAPYNVIKEGCCTQLDNVSTEFNVPPVLLSQPGLMAENIGLVLNYLKDKFKKEELIPVCCPSAEFSFEELSTPEANIFGCEPDFNAWLNGKVNEKPSSDNPYLRCAGGHIHIGYEEKSVEQNKEIIKALDLVLGAPSIFIDKDIYRRNLYGKAGAFRHKPFGVEYRVLSNFWTETPELIHWVFKGINKALDLINQGVNFNVYEEKVLKSINGFDEEAARSIIDEFEIEMPEEFAASSLVTV